MDRRTVRFSDLSEQLITEDSALVRIVVQEHPELDGQAVEIEAHVDEARVITDAALEGRRCRHLQRSARRSPGG